MAGEATQCKINFIEKQIHTYKHHAYKMVRKSSIITFQAG